jgi:hypothetical protein
MPELEMEPNNPGLEDLLFLTMAFPITYGIIGGLCYNLARKREASLFLCGVVLGIAVLLPIAHVYGGFDHHAFFRYGLSQAAEENTADNATIYQGMGKRIAILKALSVASSLVLLSIMVGVTEWKRRRAPHPFSPLDWSST